MTYLASEAQRLACHFDGEMAGYQRGQYIDEKMLTSLPVACIHSLHHLADILFVIAIRLRYVYAYPCSDIFRCSSLACRHWTSVWHHDSMGYKLVIKFYVKNWVNLLQIKLPLLIYFQMKWNSMKNDKNDPYSKNTKSKFPVPASVIITSCFNVVRHA